MRNKIRFRKNKKPQTEKKPLNFSQIPSNVLGGLSCSFNLQHSITGIGAQNAVNRQLAAEMADAEYLNFLKKIQVQNINRLLNVENKGLAKFMLCRGDSELSVLEHFKV